MAESSMTPWKMQAPQMLVAMSQSPKGVTYGFENDTRGNDYLKENNIPPEIAAFISVSGLYGAINNRAPELPK